MRKLESTIAQFVEDLLLTIGAATVDELRELFAGRPESEQILDAPVDLSSSARSSPSNRPAPPPRTARAEARGQGATRRRAFTSIASMTPSSSGSYSPPGVAEITDPESLLSLGGPSDVSALNGARFSNGSSSSRSAPADSGSPSFGDPSRAPSRARARALLDVSEGAGRADGHVERPAEPDGESPASSVRPIGTGPTVKLSDNETFARVSNSGVVIRRKKKAQG
jgi:hypothetical protein